MFRRLLRFISREPTPRHVQPSDDYPFCPACEAAIDKEPKVTRMSDQRRKRIRIVDSEKEFSE